MTTKVYNSYPEKRERVTATPTSWERVEPLPAARATLSLERTFSADEMNLVQMGVIPYEMEDK